MEDVHPHVLRQTFATRLLWEARADLVTVAELLGHESLNITARYTRPCEKDLEAVVERLRYVEGVLRVLLGRVWG